MINAVAAFIGFLLAGIAVAFAGFWCRKSVELIVATYSGCSLAVALVTVLYFLYAFQGIAAELGASTAALIPGIAFLSGTVTGYLYWRKRS